jgi:histidinol-phosphate aminotransferase
MRIHAEAHEGAVLVYLCNPNNPTGTLTDTGKIEDWVKSAPDNIYFVVDEAYHHYVAEPGYRSILPLAAKHPNLLVARTFSKVYAMAGLRLGYIVAKESLIRRLSALTQLNVNQLALTAAIASLDDQDFLGRSIASNREAKLILTDTLDQLAIRYCPSHTNFLMMQVKGPLSSFIDRMRAEGILVGRPFPPMTTYNRVSLGLPKETEIFATKLRKFRHHGWI